MIAKAKSVYYCEYCKKHGLRSNAIVEHEKHCTLNPNRYCQMCRKQTKDYKVKKLPTLNPKRERDEIIPSIAVYNTTKESIKALKYKEYLQSEIDCPWCIFSILRKNRWLFDLANFDLKEALEKYWEEKNSEEEYGY